LLTVERVSFDESLVDRFAHIEIGPALFLPAVSNTLSEVSAPNPPRQTTGPGLDTTHWPQRVMPNTTPTKKLSGLPFA
jgi:hypothetical protein